LSLSARAFRPGFARLHPAKYPLSSVAVHANGFEVMSGQVNKTLQLAGAAL
jgi:hypothetical protein